MAKPSGMKTYIADDLPALLARQQRDVLMVQLVASGLACIPGLLVQFLKGDSIKKY